MNEPAIKEAVNDNHGLLLQLVDHQKSFSEKLDTHIANTETETKRIDERIDRVQDIFRNSIDELKSTLSASGKISSGSIFALVAVLMSFATLTGGAVSAYVSVRLGNITPLISANTTAIQADEAKAAEMQRQLHQFQLEAVRADATSQSDRNWLIKIQDRTIQRVDELEKKISF